jgi:carboxyl-terminal processing protease
MVIGQFSDFAYVIAVVPGSSSDKVGIRVGDVIEYIDGHATRDLDLYDVKTLLKGTPGSSVELTLLRRRNEKIKLVRATVPKVSPEVKSLEQQIGYIKVPILSTGMAESVARSVTEATKAGAQRIILDLRGSAGGDLKEGVATANLFIKSGTLAKVIGRKDKIINTFEAEAGGRNHGSPARSDY